MSPIERVECCEVTELHEDVLHDVVWIARLVVPLHEPAHDGDVEVEEAHPRRLAHGRDVCGQLLYECVRSLWKNRHRPSSKHLHEHFFPSAVNDTTILPRCQSAGSSSAVSTSRMNSAR